MRFGVPYSVIRRSPGTYVNGLWVPAAEPASATVKLDVQPLTGGQSRLLESLPEGRRTAQTLIAYAAVGTGLKIADPGSREPGDILLIGGVRWLVVATGGLANLGTLRPTSHELYLVQREIEKAPGETPL